jgi:hypothetical protein
MVYTCGDTFVKAYTASRAPVPTTVSFVFYSWPSSHVLKESAGAGQKRPWTQRLDRRHASSLHMINATTRPACRAAYVHECRSSVCIVSQQHRFFYGSYQSRCYTSTHEHELKALFSGFVHSETSLFLACCTEEYGINMILIS